MGLTMGIVAAPCIGPFVLGLVTYVAAKGDPLYGFLMFLFLRSGWDFHICSLQSFQVKLKVYQEQESGWRELSTFLVLY